MKLKSTLKGERYMLSDQMRKKILKQLSLRIPGEKFPVLPDRMNNLLKIFGIFPKKLWNDYWIYGDLSGVWGNADGVRGDVSNIKGCLSGIVASAEEILLVLMERQQNIDECG